PGRPRVLPRHRSPRREASESAVRRARLPRREALADGPRAASARLASREDNVVREQRTVKRDEAARDEVQVRVLEAFQELAHRVGREHVQVRWILLGLAAQEEPQAVLEPERIRNGSDELPAGPQHPLPLGHEPRRIAYVLEQLAVADDVEARVRERARLVAVRPLRLDPELRRLRERLAIDVDARHLVAARVRLRECPVATTEIEDAPSGPAHVVAEESDALFAGVHEIARALRPMVLAVVLA